MSFCLFRADLWERLSHAHGREFAEQYQGRLRGGSRLRGKQGLGKQRCVAPLTANACSPSLSGTTLIHLPPFAGRSQLILPWVPAVMDGTQFTLSLWLKPTDSSTVKIIAGSIRPDGECARRRRMARLACHSWSCRESVCSRINRPYRPCYCDVAGAGDANFLMWMSGLSYRLYVSECSCGCDCCHLPQPLTRHLLLATDCRCPTDRATILGALCYACGFLLLSWFMAVRVCCSACRATATLNSWTHFAISVDTTTATVRAVVLPVLARLRC